MAEPLKYPVMVEHIQEFQRILAFWLPDIALMRDALEKALFVKLDPDQSKAQQVIEVYNSNEPWRWCSDLNELLFNLVRAAQRKF